MALGTMYPAKINSPATLITSTLDATTDAIPVAEMACFPDEPNLAVIGTSDNAETVLYTTRDTTSGAGTLGGITRGFEGTAAAWTTTESIARNFTAYDFDTLSTNLYKLTTLYAPVSGSTVYLTGTSTQFVPGTSTQFTIWGSSTNYAPITGSTIYAPISGSTIYVPGQSTDFVPGASSDYVMGTSTQFMLYGTSTDFAPITGSTEYVPGTSTNYAPFTFAIDSTVYHSTGTDITDFNVSTLLHGFVPKCLGTSSQFLSSTGGWIDGGAGTGTTTHALDSTSIHTLTDTTHFNASTLMHGFVLKLLDTSSYFLSSTGGWTEPEGGGAGATTTHALDSTSIHTISVSTNFNVTSSAHGFVPSFLATTSQYLSSTGGWATPLFVPGASSDYVTGTSTQFTLWGSSTDYAPITGSTNYVSGQATDYVTGTSTQFTLWGSSTNYAPITGSTVYSAYIHPIDSTVYHSTGTDVIVHNASTLLHGFMPKLGGYTSKYFTDAGTVVEISTATYSTQGHAHSVATTLAAGFAPILDQYSTKFITSTGGFAALSTVNINTISSAAGGAAPIGTTYSTQFLTSTGGWSALTSNHINPMTSAVGGICPIGTTYSTKYLSSTGGYTAPTINLNKTIVLYPGNAMIATTTYATLAQNLTTANTINWIGGKFTSVAGERMQWGIQMDQGWNSSNLYATFTWTAEKSSKTGNAVWELAAIRIGDNTTMHNAVASVITSTDAYLGSSTCYVMHRSAETTNFLITGAGNYITFDLTRKVATDTLTTEISILNVEIRGTYASTY